MDHKYKTNSDLNPATNFEPPASVGDDFRVIDEYFNRVYRDYDPYELPNYTTTLNQTDESEEFLRTLQDEFPEKASSHPYCAGEECLVVGENPAIEASSISEVVACNCITLLNGHEYGCPYLMYKNLLKS